ncbi:PAS domain-containing protein [Halonotius terrestris]|nr:PAS domain-containing protein [Halonotius terrestris]
MTSIDPTDETVTPPVDHDPFVIHDDGEVVYANDRCLTLLRSSSPDEVIEKPILAFVQESYHDALADQFDQLADGDADALGLAIELDPLHGAAREIVVVTSPIEWNGTRKLQSTFLDVSEQLAAEPLIERAMNAAPVGITIADAQSEDEPLLYVSDEFVEMTGYSREAALGQNCRFLQGEGTREEPVAKMRAAIDAAEPVTVVLRNYRADGSMFWNRVTIRPITGKAGEVTHFLGYQEDVSEMKLYKHEKSIFEKHAEAAPHAMFITDRDGIIEYVNPAFERMTGYTAEEAIGNTPRLIKSQQQDAAFYEDLWSTITAGEVWEEELTNQTKAGEFYRVKQTIVPIENQYGEITHFTAIEHDISETEFTEQVLDVINRILRHNLRTSINVIDGYAEILEENLDEPVELAAAEAISERADALERLSEKTSYIRDLFENREEHQVVNLDAITRYINDCHHKYPAASIDLAVAVDETVEIKNGVLLQVAIEEAIENAVVHNDAAEPVVEIVIRQPDDSAELCIEIADDGPGIPKAEWDVITASQETPLRHASGLGLWLIYWGVTALGGTVELTQNDQQGSTLIFRVPIVRERVVGDGDTE